jgi:hypothetical protein
MTHTIRLGIPPGQGRPLLQRLAIVWAVALVIALLNWSSHGYGHFDYSLVYSYAISTLIWVFTDLARLLLRRWLGAQAPHYWPTPLRAAGLLLVGIPLGYALGTWVGDGYAGQSTWALRTLHPQRFMGMLVSSLAISVAFVGFFYQRSRSEALQRQASEAQLMLLQSQLQPHMLFNTLAHLRALVQTEPQRALTMLDHLDDYLRSALAASRQTWQPLDDELQRLHDYLSLMAIRLGPRLRFGLNVPDTLRQQPVPGFILQPLVENAIRHGIEPSVDGGEIQVQVRQSEGFVQLCVRNTGAPLSASHTAGYGLAHVRERLHSLMGPAASFSLTVGAEGDTCAMLRWPLQAPNTP